MVVRILSLVFLPLVIALGNGVVSAQEISNLQYPESGGYLTSATLGQDGRAIILSSQPVPTSGSAPILLFATPNGNTACQTLGDTESSGSRWRYGNQHIAAQWRYLIEEGSLPGNSILACVEAPELSWPKALREGGAERTVRVFEQVRKLVGPHAKFEILAAHSGGGALILSAITLETTPTLRAILPEVRTIALLDANYAFEHETHGQHLARWLASDNSRCLVVLAYDDREILVNGRKIVGPTGGTLRANLRMTDSLTSLGVELDTDSDGISTRTVGLAGRVRLETLANPHNQILHTVLVERNGLIHALTPGGHKLFMESPAYRSKIRSLIPQARAPE